MELYHYDLELYEKFTGTRLYGNHNNRGDR